MERSERRLLLIVSREERESYDRALRTFVGQAEVEVILDRRYGERRRWQDAHFVERRRGERRRASIQETVRGLGWAMAASRNDESAPDAPGEGQSIRPMAQ